MSVKTYQISKGNIQLTKNLKLSEFRTPGVDTVLLDDDLAPMMERIRDGLTSVFGIEVAMTIVNSGYRTPGAGGYDRRVGGSGYGPHTTGKAADFYFREKAGKSIPSIYGLCVAQLLGLKGIERIMDGVSIHIDVNYRSNYWWAYQAKNSAGRYVYYTLSDFFTSSWAKTAGVKLPANTTPTITIDPKNDTVSLVRRGSRGAMVKLWGDVLIADGQSLGRYGNDGIFGDAYFSATKAYQQKHGLVADGIAGKASWASAGYVCR